MCFTPIVSLSTAILEFVVATAILVFCRKSLINRFFPLLIYILGFYQFTEFMLCTSNYPFFWAKMGFVTYSFLPAVALHFVMKLTNKKYNYKILYIVPVIFSLIAFLKPDFIIQSTCTTFFVIVIKDMFNSPIPLLLFIYELYYSWFIVAVCYFLLKGINKEKIPLKRKLYAVILAAVIITLFPAMVLFLIFPAFRIILPSVYCEFAVLFTVAAIISSYLDNKIQKKK
ncbi:MAG: hypothetical protein KJ968_01295 [Nanoarchaeota archaeon]|nr:hypothetical protein [Nanoarchaeota archaeon]